MRNDKEPKCFTNYIVKNVESDSEQTFDDFKSAYEKAKLLRTKGVTCYIYQQIKTLYYDETVRVHI